MHALAFVSVSALLLSPLPLTKVTPRAGVLQLSTEDESTLDDFPSDDYSGDAEPEQLPSPAPATATATATATAAPALDEAASLKQQLLGLAAACNRGEAATTADLGALGAETAGDFKRETKPHRIWQAPRANTL